MAVLLLRAALRQKIHCVTLTEYLNGGRKNSRRHSLSISTAASAGTSSHYGGARAWKDVLKYRPDVVVVDFSVNDDADEFFEETYEGVIRQLLQAPSRPAVIIMNNVFMMTVIMHRTSTIGLAPTTGIPCVSMKAAVYPMIGDGLYEAPELTPDNLHPNDLGHGYVADTIKYFLDTVRNDLASEESEPDYPAPLTANSYENSKLYQIENNCFSLEGFQVDADEKKRNAGFI